jgi:hypothetical protein
MLATRRKATMPASIVSLKSPRGRTSLSPIAKPGDWTSSACISSIESAFAMPAPPPPMKP